MRQPLIVSRLARPQSTTVTFRELPELTPVGLPSNIKGIDRAKMNRDAPTRAPLGAITAQSSKGGKDTTTTGQSCQQNSSEFLLNRILSESC